MTDADLNTSQQPPQARRWWRRAAAAFLLVVAAMALGLFALMKAAEPRDRGELLLPRATERQPGLRAEVRIERDGHGVPTITAGSLEDAAYALGFAHGQDRLWQLEMHRRIGAGRLAEVFGPSVLDNDRFLRALGIRRAAAAQYARLSSSSRALLQAYSAGVNQAIADTSVLPPEFLVLGVRPEPWDAVDSLAWSLMMAWDLGGNWTTEMQRLRLSAVMARERIDELLPPYPDDEHPATRDYPTLYRELGLVPQGPRAALRDQWLELLEKAPPSGIEGTGSNNWVLAGSRSTSGKPLLANDPHLGLTTPALWYFARIHTPGLKVAGATLPGMPLVVLGQNEHLAWGFTNTGPDVQDLYIEAVDPEDPTRYRTPSGTAPFSSVEEVIKVKGEPDVRLTVRRTRHGPVISDAGTLKGLELGSHVLAMRWTALDEDIDVIAAGLGLGQADSVASFITAAQRWVAPMQNMVVADREGRIGLVAAGRVPVRRADNDLMGQAPAPGWESRYDWVGWVPAHETPRAVNPPQGWLATANQRIHGPDYPHYLGSDWALPYRQLRIEQVLESRATHTLEQMVELQQDETSLAARELLPWLQKARSSHRLAPQGSNLLASFDGVMRADSSAALLMWAWHRSLVRALFAPRIGTERFERAFAGRSFQDALLGVLERDDAWWCDDPQTPQPETCAQRVDEAYTAALEELSRRFGDQPSRWQWGQAHRVEAEHRPFSKVSVLQPWFALSRPIGGDTHTVHALRVGLSGPENSLYRSTHGPSLKAVYDLGDPRRSRFIHSSGQSGLPWHPHYRAWMEPWARGEGVPLWADEVSGSMPAGGSARTLVLRPAR